MAILWGTRVAGQGVAVGEDELGGHVIIGGPPDVVRTPPDIGGEEFRVSAAYWRDCPCGGKHEGQTLTLFGTDLQVTECPARGFLWWRPRR